MIHLLRKALRHDLSGFIGRATVWSIVFGLMLAVPTDLIETPLFTRMTPTRWWQYLLWASASVLGGAVMAVRRLPGAAACPFEKRTAAGGAATFVAVGCPICNKLVVALLGVAGALDYFAPAQPIIGAVSVALLVMVLHRQSKLAGRGSTRLLPMKEGT